MNPEQVIGRRGDSAEEVPNLPGILPGVTLIDPGLPFGETFYITLQLLKLRLILRLEAPLAFKPIMPEFYSVSRPGGAGKIGGRFAPCLGHLETGAERAGQAAVAP